MRDTTSADATTLQSADQLHDEAMGGHTLPLRGSALVGNTSRTEPAKFLVLLLKKEGVEPVLPAK